jgi:tRNA 2-thiouridine synthesizing protein A
MGGRRSAGIDRPGLIEKARLAMITLPCMKEGPMADSELDARGLACPLPVLRARKALRALSPGEVLRLLATDPGAKRDVSAMCEATGDRLIESEDTDGVLTFRIERAG